jgi:pyruvate dehydrogenase E1 component alpha subunit
MAELFAAGKIKSPLHLSGGNERQLISIFAPIRDNDWILTGWRSHYHCLLKGVPPDELEQAILNGRSINLCFPEYRILSSAIVGGICPIAVGIAWSIKKRGTSEKVYAFVGDMSAESGIFHECKKYAGGHDLPVNFIVENNGVSVCTDTKEVWGIPKTLRSRGQGYDYKLTRPHVGIGRFVVF